MNLNISINPTFTTENFTNYNNLLKKITYQEANETHNVELVRQLNNLELKPEVPTFSGPTIISCFMDIATKHDTILGFLKELRETNRLLTEKEFQSLYEKKWIHKSNRISRILGSNHIARMAMENQLQHIKVPLKIAVVEEKNSLEVSGWYYQNNLYDISSDQINIYAEKIISVDRKLLREEIDELIQIIAKANFSDLLPANIILGKDGIYFIDTEFKSFSVEISWEKMGRFEGLINEEDKTYFYDKVEEKINESSSRKENKQSDYLNNLDYEKLKYIFDIISESESSKQDKTVIEKMKSNIQSLEYVGTKVAGKSWFKPNKFSFNLNDILG